VRVLLETATTPVQVSSSNAPADASTPVDASVPVATPRPTVAAQPPVPARKVGSRIGAGMTTADRGQWFGSCASNADCDVTNFAGCCSSCPDAPRVTSTKLEQAETRRCAVIDCVMSDPKPCPAVESAANYRAVCVEGACDAIKMR